MKLRIGCVVVGLLSLVLSLVQLTLAQTPTQTASALPRLVRFTGIAKDLNGNPLTGMVGITFALYSEQNGGAALWLETQNVTADSNGHYTVLLGSTKPDGLPADLFTSEQAHWVGVQISGQAEQPRVLLVSAPYALKAGDAETVGGLPPSAFVLAAPVNGSVSNAATSSEITSSASSSSVSPATTSDVTTTGGTVNTIPLFSTATNIQNSILTQKGTTAVNVVGQLNLPATAAATKTAGTMSQPLDFVASSFSSSTSAAVNQTFQWKAEPTANDTATPSGTLNLLFASGTAAPAATGLALSSKGIFTFATGQTFPGTGAGTVTSVASGTGLTGGPITGSGTLSIASKACAAGSALSALPFTCSPFATLAANTFKGNQTVTGNITSSGTITDNTGNTIGVQGQSSSTSGMGVEGVATAAVGNGYGVYGTNNTQAGAGVEGYAANTSGGIGVQGTSVGSYGIGVKGTGATGVVGVSTGPGSSGDTTDINGAAILLVSRSRQVLV
jgi:hypothetical protein